VHDRRYSTHGRVKQSEKHKLNAHVYRKSDKTIVVMKQANKMTSELIIMSTKRVKRSLWSEGF